MTKENLQKLIGAHNALYDINVHGEAVIPMARVMMVMRSVIESEAEALDLNVEADNAGETENKMEVDE